MCAACVAQGITYVGGALGGLQVMAARAKAKRQKPSEPELPEAEVPEVPKAEVPEREEAPALT